MTRTIHIISRINSSDERVRVKKFIEILNQNNIDNVAIFNPDLNFNNKYTGYFGYLIWSYLCIKKCLTLPIGTIIHAVGFNVAFPVFIASYLRNFDFIFDNADNISMSHPWSKLVKSILIFIEKKIAKRAKIHLIPNVERWDYDNSNLVELPNFPNKSSFEAARDLKNSMSLNGQGEKFTLYVTGWLVRTRGMNVLLKALNILKEKKCEINVLICGGASTDAKDLLRHKYVSYKGLMSYEESLAYNFLVDLVFTYYDPSIEINRMAGSNKWGDCLFTRTPFIVNSEVKTAQGYIKQGLCLDLPYNDHEKLASLLEGLIKDKTILGDIRSRMKKIKISYWDDKVIKLYQGII